MSLYSGTKYLSGFSDMLAGVALTKSSDLIQKIRSRRNMFGSILQPDECWTLSSRLPYRRAAYDALQQERAAAGRSSPRPQANQPRHLSNAVPGPRAETHI
ncbi:MAG: PLP-dependent transferase [Ignavibacteriota bacterium]